MHRIKAVAILVIIILSLLPAYQLHRYLQRVMRPKESMRRFLSWLCIVFFLVFAYSFLLVLGIKLLFPGA